MSQVAQRLFKFRSLLWTLVVRELKAPSRRGINRIVWDLQPPPRQRLENPDQLPDFVPAGTYKVTVSLGDEERTTTVEVLPVPGK